MDAQQYLEQRLQSQLDWFEAKAAFNQKRYKRLKVFDIMVAAAIPVVTGYVGTDATFAPIGLPQVEINDVLKFAVAVGGGLIAVSSGLASLNKYHELWVEYRTTAEMLRQHRFLFETRTGPYAVPDEEALAKLVENVETILAKENLGWAGLNKPQAGNGSNAQGNAAPEAPTPPVGASQP